MLDGPIKYKEKPFRLMDLSSPSLVMSLLESAVKSFHGLKKKNVFLLFVNYICVIFLNRNFPLLMQAWKLGPALATGIQLVLSF